MEFRNNKEKENKNEKDRPNKNIKFDPKKNKKLIIYCIIGFIILSVLRVSLFAPLFNSGKEEVEASYDEFMLALEGKKVSEVSVEDDYIYYSQTDKKEA